MADLLASGPSDPRRAGEPGEITTTRVAGPVQAILLICTSCLSVLGIVLLAPVQPLMVTAFADTPRVDVLVPLAITMPALMIALFAPLAGRIADRTGRVRLLTGSLIAYAFFGTAPLWLPTLELVIVSRIGFGLAEAGALTCATALLGDLWSGPARSRMIGFQVLAVSASAVVVVAVGGVLGDAGWRVPFWLYLLSLVIALAAPRLLWNPGGPPRTTALPPLPWRSLSGPLTMTFLGSIVFYAPLLELSYVLDRMGVTSTSTIGLISAAAAAASAFASGLFGRISRAGPRILLPVALGLAGVGLVVLGLADSVPVIVVGAVVSSAGSGVLVPTLLTWALASLDTTRRGRVTGIWYSCLTAGQVACPLLILAAGAVAGGLPGALVTIGVAALVLAAAGSRVPTR